MRDVEMLVPPAGSRGTPLNFAFVVTECHEAIAQPQIAASRASGWVARMRRRRNAATCRRRAAGLVSAAKVRTAA
jgi:hypothetical protein